MGHSIVWVIIVSLVISLSLSITFTFFSSLSLAILLLIGISYYMRKQTMLGMNDIIRDSICNRMLLRSSGLNYLCCSYDHNSKSESYRHSRSKMRRGGF